MRVLKFVSLKIAESGGVLFLLYLGAIYENWICPMLGNKHEEHLEYHYWMVNGLVGLLLFFLTIAIPCVVGYLLFQLVKSNWKWSA